MEEEFVKFQEAFKKLQETLEAQMIGMQETLYFLLVGIFSGGHLLLEGMPGLGKTSMVRKLCKALGLEFSRIQFTPDLMPADILGTHLIIETEHGKKFQFRKGPIFGNCILADEINRATPKTQSALLEAMEEKTVSLAREVYPMDDPFFVIATQNPLDMEGTYPLPEAQLDRFLFKIQLQLGTVQDLNLILDRHTGTEELPLSQVFPGAGLSQWTRIARKVLLAPFIKERISQLVLATHPHSNSSPEEVKKYVKFGAGPRGALALALASKVCALREGRVSVSREDVSKVLYPALRHRILLNFQGEAEGKTTDTLLAVLAERYLS